MLRQKVSRLLGVTCTVCILCTMLSGCGKEEMTYRETTVEYGALVVGKTESGSVDIGSVEQIFELDMSALQRVDLSGNKGNASSMPNMQGGMGGNAGGADMFSQMFNMAGNNSLISSSNNNNLVISEVCITIGEKVEEGDVLYYLEEKGVSELAEELEFNADKAKADLEAVIADQNLSRVTAQYTYESSLAYGEYATMEKESTIAELEKTLKEKKDLLAQEKENLSNYEAELKFLKEEYVKAEEANKNAIWGRDNTNKYSNLYDYTVSANQAISTQKLVNDLSNQIEQMESKIQQSQNSVVNYEKQASSAQRALEQGKLTARETYELRELAYKTAQETYDITLAYLENDLETQEDIYEEAREKWEEFTSHIDGNAIRSKYSGVITQVSFAVGDNVQTGDTIITLYDTSEVSMTVTMDEEDMTDIVVGSRANISFTAYPENIYKATVSEISDATTDSSGNVTYDVTVVIEDDSTGLFQGMTGEVTLITKESKEVKYVSNRAIIRQGKKAYVKVKEADGEIRKVEIQTGFSDGVNVEVIEGLEVGDVVLIESKV